MENQPTYRAPEPNGYIPPCKHTITLALRVRDATRLHAMRELKKGRQKTQSLNKNINKMPAKLKEHAKLKKTALKLKKNVAK